MLMRHSLMLAALLLPLAACSKREEPDLSPELRAAVVEIARQQSAAFTNGTCVIHQAYRYTGTLPFPRDGTNVYLGLVVELSGYSEHFDLDDVDLIDADTGENLGSDPGIWLLHDQDGAADSGPKEWPAAPGPATVFLLYERERLPQRVKLGYWEAEIVKQPVAVAATGRDMFKPK
jgi:hypothetical protein